MFSPEFRLLLLSCRLVDAGGKVDEACKIIKENRIDWVDLCKRAYFHRVEPQLSDLLDKLPSPTIPEDIRSELKESVQANLVGQMRYVAEFFRIKEWLDNEKITVVPFKGFWLGESVYGNLAGRTSSDIDLFIGLGDLENVKRIMTGKGYSGHESLVELTDAYIQSEMAEYNFDRYENGVCQAHVEFHWRSTMSFYRMGITLEDMMPQIIKDTLQGREVEVFSPSANLLLVVMHHGGKECFWQLKQILDIAHIIRRYPDLDIEWLFQQTERFHVRSLLFLGVRLASELTGISIPAVFVGDGNSERISRMARSRFRLLAKPVSELSTYKDRVASWLFKIRSRDGLKTKVQLLYYTLRKIIAPRLVPGKLHYLFFSRKIRKN